jgi:lysozyme family protein
MAEFLASQPYVLLNEGGYAALDLDTYRGIARRFFSAWEGWQLVDDNKPLAPGEIIPSAELDGLVDAFYKTNFWDKLLGDSIDSQAVATYCYDWYVNAGHNALKGIQSVLGVTADGVFGRETLQALNAAGDILPALHDRRVAYYRDIATGDNAKFLAGWEHRANGLFEKLA